MRKILIVDDEPNLVEGLEFFLMEIIPQDYDILKAYSCKEALEIISEGYVDLLISDIMMPGINGFKLLEIVERVCPNCRVIFLTGYDDFKWAQEAVKHKNCVDYILKTQGDKVIGTSVLKQIHILEMDNAKEQEQISILLKPSAQEATGKIVECTNVKLENNSNICMIWIDQSDNTNVYDLALAAMLQRAIPESRTKIARTGENEYLCVLNFENTYEISTISAQIRFGLEKVHEQLLALGVLISSAYSNDVVNMGNAYEKIGQLRSMRQVRENKATGVIINANSYVKSVDDDDNSVIAYIKQYITDHIGDTNISLPAFAQKTFYSPSYLSRLFRQKTGTTITMYIAETRINISKRLLVSGEYTVKEISKLVGFESPSYFSAFFRRFTGCTPLQYARNHMENMQ